MPAGELFVNLELTSNISQGVQVAKSELGGLNPAIKETSGNMDLLDNANHKNAVGFRAVGTVAAMAGGALLSTGIAAQAAGGDLATFAPILIGVGGAMTAVGTISMIAQPAIRALGWVHTAAIPGIISFTSALWAENAALTALGAATVVGAVAIGLYLLYQTMNQSKNAAADLEKEIKALTETTGELKYIQIAADEKLKGLKSTLDSSGDAVKNLQKDYDDLNTAMGKQLDIADKLRHVDLDIADAKQTQKDANKDLIAAMKTGDPDEIQRARNRKNNADEAYQDSIRNKKAVQDEDATQKATIKTLEDKNKVTSPQQLLDKISGVIDAQSKAQEKYNAQLLITEGIENRIKKNDFYAKLLDWQKSGVVLSEEDKSAYASGPDWMKSAYGDYSKKYASTTKNPDYLYNVFGPAYEQMAGGYGYLRGENTGQVEDFAKTANNNIRWSPQTVTNPNAGGMAGTFKIIIQGTVTDKELAFNPSTGQLKQINATVNGV